MAILHKNISAEGDIHNPKWFSGANNGDVAWRNELGVLESTDELVLPAALDFVDGSVAPPTSNSGDIYVLSSGASVNAGWGTVSLGDWVRYDGTTWNVITPQKSSLCYNETTDALNSYDGSTWSAIGSGGGGGNTIYTADDSLTGDRTVDLDGNILSFETNQVAGKLPPFFKVNELGDVELLANDANYALKIYDSITSGQINFSVLRDGVNKIVATPSGLDIGYFGGSGLKGTEHSATSFNVYANGSKEHDFYTANSVNNYVWLFRNGLTGSKKLYIGGTSINTTAHTHIHSGLAVKGNGTSTGSALAIYDNDTTPNKVFEVLDDSTIKTNGTAGFTGTGNYTTFTIENGIITNAS